MKKSLVTLSFTLLIIFVAVFGVSGVSAYADSETDFLYFEKDAGQVTYPTETTGVSYTVYCSEYATKLAYSFSNDLSETNSGEIALSVNPKNAKQQIGKFTAHANGEYTFTASITNGGKSYTVSTADDESGLVLTEIDPQYPKLVDYSSLWGSSAYFKNLWTEDGIWNYTFTAYDNVPTQDFVSTYSGIGRILVFCLDITEEVPDNLQELLESGEPIESGITIILDKDYTKAGKVYEQDFSFALNEKGFYFFMLQDRAGNTSPVEFLFVNYPDPKYYLTFDNQTVDVNPLITSVLETVESGAETYTDSLLKEAETAALLLQNSFLTVADEDVTEAITAERKKLYNALYAANKKLINAKVNFEVSIVNAELLDGTIDIGNFNSYYFPDLKKGETVKLEIIVAEIARKSQYPDSVIAQSSVEEPNTLYKLSYRITLNGETVAPSSALTVKITWKGSVAAADVVGVASDGTINKEYSSNSDGSGWTVFYTDAAEKTFYVVVNDPNAASKLLWLWILLGVIGGMLIAAVPIYIFVLRPKLIASGKIKPKKSGDKPSENGDNDKEINTDEGKHDEIS